MFDGGGGDGSVASRFCWRQVRDVGIGDASDYYEIYPDGKDGDPVTVYCDLTLGADYYMCEDCDEFWRYSPSEWVSTNALSYSFDWHPGVGYCDDCDDCEWRDKNAGSLQECWEKCTNNQNFGTACVNWNPQEEECYCMGVGSDDDDDECVSAYSSLTCEDGSLMLSVGCDDDGCSNCTMTADYTEYSGGVYYCDNTYYYYDSDLDGTPEGFAELPSPSCYWVSCDDDGLPAGTCIRSEDVNWGVAVPRGTAFPGDCDDGYEHECPGGMEPIIPRSREHWARSVCSHVDNLVL